MRNNRWLVFLILATLALSSVGATLRSKGTIRGYVFLDTNGNGVFDADEEGLAGAFVTISYGEYQHTYYSGDGDPNGDSPGPGSYGPSALQAGYWKVTVHVPDGYRATSRTELFALVPEGGAATGIDFGLAGSGPITYAGGTGAGMGGGGGILPQTGGVAASSIAGLIGLLAALIGFLALIGTPWCVTQAKRAYRRWW